MRQCRCAAAMLRGFRPPQARSPQSTCLPRPVVRFGRAYRAGWCQAAAIRATSEDDKTPRRRHQLGRCGQESLDQISVHPDIPRASTTSMPRYRTIDSNLDWLGSNLNRAQAFRAPASQHRLGKDRKEACRHAPS